MALLARTADRLYWAARYVERSEDTARIIRAYHELVVDSPGDAPIRWEPLCAIAGSDPTLDISPDDVTGELGVLQYLIADQSNPGSVFSTVALARENLRTTREIIPREAWIAINSLSQYVEAAASGAVHRQLRDRFLGRVIEDSRRLDGVLESTMTRDNSYRLFRLGRLIERADMTTRVLGVRAASLMHARRHQHQAQWSNGQAQSQMVAGHSEEIHDEVEWMGVLRSVSALQMYQRATRGPIDGDKVVRFLLFYGTFPRSVQSCVDEIRVVLHGLPDPDDVLSVLEGMQRILSDCDPIVTDPDALDRAMDQLQVAIGDVGGAVRERYVAASS